MRMRDSFRLVFWLLLFCSVRPFSFAIENLQEDCDDLLSTQQFDITPDISVSLTANQILIRGRLEPYWEQGMEDHMGWAVFDDDHELRMFRSSIDSLYFLKSGNHVFILDEDGDVLISGYYGESVTPQTNQNHPALYHDPELTLPALSSKDFVEYFEKHQRVVAIQTLEPKEIQRLRSHLLPQMEAYYRHLENPDRYIWAAGRVVYELAHYEQALSGRIRWSRAQLSFAQVTLTDEGYSTYYNNEPGVRLYLESPQEGTVAIRYGEQVLFFDKNEELLWQVTMDSGQGVKVRQSGGVDLLEILAKTKRVLVIRPKRAI